jgi:hypothetical protein
MAMKFLEIDEMVGIMRIWSKMKCTGLIADWSQFH